VFSAVFGTLLLLALAVTLTFFLLKNDDTLADGLRELFGGSDTTAYAYAATVDRDLESVFFGNFLFVVAMAVIATAVYWGTNLLAPAGLRVPMIFVLMLDAVRIVLPELVHGEPVRPGLEMGESVGTDPEEVRDEAADGDGGGSAGEE
jgi:hypothetical protein